MNREKRSVTLAILTLVVYASFLFYETGAILFPFPLNELIVLIVSIPAQLEIKDVFLVLKFIERSIIKTILRKKRK